MLLEISDTWISTIPLECTLMSTASNNVTRGVIPSSALTRVLMVTFSWAMLVIASAARRIKDTPEPEIRVPLTRGAYRLRMATKPVKAPSSAICSWHPGLLANRLRV